MNKLAELHIEKATEWIKANTSEKTEDEYHADLTHDFTKKFTNWMVIMANSAEVDVNLQGIDDYIKHFAEKIYKPE